MLVVLQVLRVVQLLGWPQLNVKRSFLGIFGLKMLQFFMFFFWDFFLFYIEVFLKLMKAFCETKLLLMTIL